MSRARHVESGTIECPYGEKNYHGREEAWSYASQTSQFTQAYDTPPHVSLAVVSNDHLYGDDIDYYVKLHTTTEHGFTFRCYSLTGRKVYSIRVNWLSIAS